ncbi:actin cortical patch SUR7/pH-response regulator pali [Xylogone sp. PMI_703]|nr:actin cortical patch SUR7/pH-response regulator pali [Xylogone sp. PMI_703]
MRITILLALFFTTLSLISTIVIISGGLNSKLLNLYLIKADISNSMGLVHNSQILDNFTSTIDTEIAHINGLEEEYTVYLWSYCTTNNSTKRCSDPSLHFRFDPVQAWHLNETFLVQTLPSIVKKASQTYQKISRDVPNLYLAAMSVTAATCSLGFCAFFLHILSVFPFPFILLFFSLCSMGLLLGGAVLVTSVYGGLVTTFDTVLRGHGIHVSLGWNLLKLIWIAFSSSALATFFWLIGCLCCCLC